MSRPLGPSGQFDESVRTLQSEEWHRYVGHMAEVRNARADSAGRLRPFARDVAVNVLANLVAGAILYLIGAAAGLLPRTPLTIVPALGVLFFGIYLAGVFVKGPWGFRLMSISFALTAAGGAVVLYAIGGNDVWAWSLAGVAILLVLLAILMWSAGDES